MNVTAATPAAVAALAAAVTGAAASATAGYRTTLLLDGAGCYRCSLLLLLEGESYQNMRSKQYL